MKNIVWLFLLSIILISCVDDDSTEVTSGAMGFAFYHTWDGEEVNFEDFNRFDYTNANGEVMSISKLKYLISDIILTNSAEEQIEISGYFLVDVGLDRTFISVANIPFDTYTNVEFTFGFDEEDNIDGEYPALNAELWNWPVDLGGGYHFMQFEGKYQSGAEDKPYALHMGTAKVDDTTFEQNYFEVSFSEEFTFDRPGTLAFNVKLDEWFKNPFVWELNTYDVDLMPNYDAQKMMQENGVSVFGLFGDD